MKEFKNKVAVITGAASGIGKALAKKYKVLVIDSDESNFGLHRHLGLELPEDFTRYWGGTRGVLDKMPRGGQQQLFEKKWGLEDIPEEYLTEKDNIKLLAIGKIHDVGEGCACPMAMLAREFLENLQLNDNSELAIGDTDAGIEHFGRGVERGVDIIIMVVDPSYESIQLAHKINSLAETISKPIYFVLNKVKAEIKDNLTNAVPSNKVIGIMPNNKEIFSSGLLGKEIDVKIEELDRLSEILTNILLTTKT